MQKTILVTGGAGYIGSHTCLELLNANYKVVAIDNLSNSKSDSLSRVEDITGKSMQFHLADLRDPVVMEKLFESESIDAVIHFAGLKAVGESTEIPLDYYQNNIGGTANLLEAMNHHGVKDIVFSSSCTVYGIPDQLPVTENTPLKPAESPYGQTKQMGEQIIKDTLKFSNTQGVLLRYFNPAGAHSSFGLGQGFLREDANTRP